MGQLPRPPTENQRALRGRARFAAGTDERLCETRQRSKVTGCLRPPRPVHASQRPAVIKLGRRGGRWLPKGRRVPNGRPVPNTREEDLLPTLGRESGGRPGGGRMGSVPPRRCTHNQRGRGWRKRECTPVDPRRPRIPRTPARRLSVRRRIQRPGRQHSVVEPFASDLGPQGEQGG